MHQTPTPEELRIEQAARGLLGGLGRVSRILFESGDFGLPRSYVNALDALEPGPLRVTELTGPTGLTQPRVTVVLQHLEERGLIERHRCSEDRRSIKAQLTPAGREVLETGRQHMAARLLEALENVDHPEQTVTAAREAVCSLLKALEPEVS
ncbi:MarR family winged helix-turn-helix transcriptional regulator [Phaeacidiphilus oryzae]|jgi:DNA-binding MarR family transcriptional regulator|uniref:MarR family winged helix-turn-helix transcriptional regulator n=1 Tax=Phaeacidiphilus oryzae TaxID=348818 RepID=UPI000568F76F|nr:MarR family transcriptional regulator [Phaeacidiphilus oryzae]